MTNYSKYKTRWLYSLDRMGYQPDESQFYWTQPFPGSHKDPEFNLYWKFPIYGEGGGAKGKSLMVADPSLKQAIREERTLRHYVTSPMRAERGRKHAKQVLTRYKESGYRGHNTSIDRLVRAIRERKASGGLHTRPVSRAAQTQRAARQKRYARVHKRTQARKRTYRKYYPKK